MASDPTGRVLVLGGTGMFGHTVFGNLRLHGFDVARTTRSRQGDSIPFDAQGGQGAIRDLLARQGPFGWIINGIAVGPSMIDESESSSVRLTEQINGEFPHQLATVAAPLGARIIHISTDAVFSETAGRCLETTPTGPTTVYGRTRLRGEVNHPAVLNIRTSMYGMDPAHGRGLFEWFRRQPAGARVPGFTDQLWAGCTTLQLARLCRAFIAGMFDAARAQGAIHHFCPLGPMSNFELLSGLNRGAKVPLEIVPTISGSPSTRHLDTALNLRYNCQTTRLSKVA